MHIINQEVNTAILWRVALQLPFLPLLWVFLNFFFQRVLCILLASFTPFTVIQHSDLGLCSQKVLDETSFACLLYFFITGA